MSAGDNASSGGTRRSVRLASKPAHVYVSSEILAVRAHRGDTAEEGQFHVKLASDPTRYQWIRTTEINHNTLRNGTTLTAYWKDKHGCRSWYNLFGKKEKSSRKESQIKAYFVVSYSVDNFKKEFGGISDYSLPKSQVSAFPVKELLQICYRHMYWTVYLPQIVVEIGIRHPELGHMIWVHPDGVIDLKSFVKHSNRSSKKFRIELQLLTKRYVDDFVETYRTAEEDKMDDDESSEEPKSPQSKASSSVSASEVAEAGDDDGDVMMEG